MKGHVHASALTGSIIFAYVLLFGLAWHLSRTALVNSEGEKRNTLGKAMANFY